MEHDEQGTEAASIARRRRRLTDDEIRAAMLNAGREYIGEQGGLSVSLHHLNYEEIMVRSGISRSSVYRVWQYKELYFVDLVSALTNFEWMTGTDPTPLETILVGLEELVGQGERLVDPVFRRSVAMEIARGSLTQALASPVVRRVWQNYLFAVAVLATSESDHNAPPVGGSYDFDGEAKVNLLTVDAALTVVGYRPRPGRDVLGFYKLTILLTEGYMTRLLSDATPYDTLYTVDLGTGPTEIPLVSLALTALFDGFFEPDPGYDPATAREKFLATATDIREELRKLVKPPAHDPQPGAP